MAGHGVASCEDFIVGSHVKRPQTHEDLVVGTAVMLYASAGASNTGPRAWLHQSPPWFRWNRATGRAADAGLRAAPGAVVVVAATE